MDKTMLLLVFTATCLHVALGVFTLTGPAAFDEQTATITVTFTVDAANLVTTTDGAVFGLTATTTDITTDSMDFNPISSVSLTGAFSTGDNLGHVNVDIGLLDDFAFEGPETFTLSLTTGGNINSFVTDDFTITINDDDLPPLPLRVPGNIETSENVGDYSFTVLLAATAQAKDVVFSITTEGNGDIPHTQAATPDVDYTTLSESTMIPAGSTMQTFEIPILEDTDPEYTECIKVTLYGPGIVQNYTFNICILDNDLPVHYDCRRPGQGCKNGGTCNDATRTCDCDPGFSFVDCSVKDTDIIIPPCGVQCNATHINPIDNSTAQNGLCVNNAVGMNECKCYPGWTGPDCSVSAYMGECMPGGGISFCIVPFGDFGGTMKVGGAADCELVSTPTATCLGFNGEFEFENDLGCNATVINNVGSVTWEMGVEIQYSQVVAIFREDLIVACSSAPSGTVTIDFGNVDVDTTPAGVTVGPQNPPIRQINELPVGTPSVMTQGLQPVTPTTPVTSGERLTFCLTISDTQFAGFNFFDLILTNALDIANSLFVSVPLITGGCIAPGADILITPIPINADATPFYRCFDFYAVKLEHTNMIEVVGSVSLTAIGDPYVPISCPARKRRQAEDEGSADQTKGSYRYTIELKQDDFAPVQAAIKECERSLLMPATVGLGVVCLTLLIVVALLAATVIRHQRTKQKLIH